MRDQRSPYRRRLGALLVGAAIIAGGAAYLHHIDWHTTLAVIAGAAPAALALAYGLHVVSLLAKAGVWWVCLRAIGRPAFTIVLRLTFLGSALNSLLVANSGEVGRVMLISRLTGMRISSAFATVAAERLINICGFVMVLIAAAWWMPLPAPMGRWMLGGAGIIVMTVVVIGLRRGGRAVSIARPPRRKPRRVVRAMCIHLRRTLLAVRRIGTPARLASAGAMTLVDWTCQLASYHLVARAAHLPIPLSGSVLALLAVNLGLVVRVTPGNVGIFEVAYAAVAVSQGAPPAAALGVGMLIHLVQDLPTIVLGLASGHSLKRSAGVTRALVDLTAGMSATGPCRLDKLPPAGGTIP